MNDREIIPEADALALIAEHHIVWVDTSDAAVEFTLSNGRRLILWDASYERDREWEDALSPATREMVAGLPADVLAEPALLKATLDRCERSRIDGQGQLRSRIAAEVREDVHLRYLAGGEKTTVPTSLSRDEADLILNNMGRSMEMRMHQEPDEDEQSVIDKLRPIATPWEGDWWER